MTIKGDKIEKVYQLKITLNWLDPPIWRRVLVPADIPLTTLHSVVQLAMGWENSHLHSFMAGEQLYEEPDPDADAYGESPAQDERKVRLSEIAPKERQKIQYVYDFGDSWEHEILIEKILDPEPRRGYPICLAGERACPPEDCGGPPGYEGLLDALADPNHPEHEDLADWLGGEGFDSEAFDLDRVNKSLCRIR